VVTFLVRSSMTRSWRYCAWVHHLEQIRLSHSSKIRSCSALNNVLYKIGQSGLAIRPTLPTFSEEQLNRLPWSWQSEWKVTVEHEYDVFEKLPDRSIRWRTSVRGIQPALATLDVISNKTTNECFAIHIDTKTIIGTVRTRSMAASRASRAGHFCD
jgi:hypothetical protein